MRSVPEWIGATDDTPIPARVKLRIFEREGGRCHFSGRKIMPGDAYDFDHIIAIGNGGKNRESNIAPILRDVEHKQKTAADVAEMAKVRRMRAKHLGIYPPSKAKIKGRGFPKTRSMWAASGDPEHWETSE